MDSKGAIELSANFIVIIVISSVILIGGLTLFYNLQGQAEKYVDTINSQTEAKVRSMMLDGKGDVAVYPSALELSFEGGEAVGVGITNHNRDNLEGPFDISVSVRHYNSADEDAVQIENDEDYYSMTSGSFNIPIGSQDVKSILLKIPKRSESLGEGQYIYTISITNSGENHGVVQVYVTV